MTSVIDAPRPPAEPFVEGTAERAGQRFPIGFVILSIVLSILLRARFLFTPLTSDEGGYLAVARAWASGKSLYGDAWVDRPQGLLILFRLWDDVSGGSTAAIRIMAMLFGCIAVVAVAYVAFAIAGSQAAAAASVLIAVASANARIEGFIANGELLAGALGAAGVAVASAYLFRGRGMHLLYIAGLLAGCAISLKQSGFDGFAAVMVCILAGGFTRESTWRRVAREAGTCFAGAATVLALLVLHGITVGFSNWWYAVAGYRLSGINASSDANWHRFGITSRLAAPSLLPLVGLMLLGVVVWLAFSRRIRRSIVLIAAWICFAAVGFVAGGLFHRHYWVTLTFPLAVAAGVALSNVTAPVATTLVCLAIIPSLVSSAHVIRLDRSEVGIVADDDPRLLVDEAIGRWYPGVRTPDSTLYVLCASAGAYAATDTVPPFPYLWLDGVQHGRDAQEKLVQMFAGDHPPTYVARYQSFFTCNPSGAVEDLIRQRYTPLGNVHGALVYRLREPVPAVSAFGSELPSRRA